MRCQSGARLLKNSISFTRIKFCQWIELQSGIIDRHKGNNKNELYPGDVFVMETPSGGGFGTKN